ncbi:hypothetical protein XI05_08880 [Bradyrhizobium sp. CCBAU 11357]|nr:hypothetical protein [Bradyrhizobium sp. CCBAU 11357]
MKLGTSILLDGKFRVLRGAIIPYEAVEHWATYVDSIKAWRFVLGSVERNRRDAKVAGSGSNYLVVKPARRPEGRLDWAMADHALQTVPTEKPDNVQSLSHFQD